VPATTPATSETDIAGQPRSWWPRVAILLLAAYWLLLVTATHIPKVPEPLGFRTSDKVQHLVAYGTLSVLAAVAWSLARPFGWCQALVLLALIAGHGILDEVTQPIFGRNADVLDWYADVTGAALGLSGFWIGRQALRRWRKSQSFTD
jgi:VanZ family protein